MNAVLEQDNFNNNNNKDDDDDNKEDDINKSTL